MFKKPLLLFLITLICVANLSAKSRKIIVELKNCTDSVLYLGNYYGNKQFLLDTAFKDKKGLFVFEESEKWQAGMYMVVNTKKVKYFDFMLTDEQTLNFSCDPTHITETMRIKGSVENTVFYDYIDFIAQKQKESTPLRKQLANEKTPEGQKSIREKLTGIDNEVSSYMSSISAKYPLLLATHFINAIREPDILPYLTLPNGSIDSSRLYQTYKEHYFDHFDFSDPRMAYTPIYSLKIDSYFDKIAPQNVDSLKTEIDHVFKLASANSEMQKYTAWYLLSHYETSPIMGFDALFVYISSKYLLPGKIEWQYPSVKTNVEKRVKTLDPILIGKTAPNLIMFDTAETPSGLHTVMARYTLILFWESTCSHCKQEMPKLLELYKEMHAKYYVEVFAVSADTSLTAWKAFISEYKLPWINVNGNLSITPNFHELYDIYSTPVMYLLDEKKTIIAKRVLSEELRKFIEYREKAEIK